MSKRTVLIGSVFAIICLAGVAAYAQNKPDPKAPQESERKVMENEVPKAALDALKAQAAGNAITEFAEEIEHGHKFYEGSWKSATGHVDVLVTEDGALVEIEESIPADKVPAGARGEVEKLAGKNGGAKYEKKTMILYEAHFKKDGKGHEVIVTPDGRRFHEESDEDGDEDDGDDEKK